jgi:hypothetical protein
VRYEAVNAMLLNEFLKEHRKVQALEADFVRQQKEITALTARLKVRALQIQPMRGQFAANKPATLPPGWRPTTDKTDPRARLPVAQR